MNKSSQNYDEHAQETNELSFNLYGGGYGSPVTKVKVYITEDIENFGEPVKDWTFTTSTSGKTTAPMGPYYGKSVYVVFVVEAGDFIFWNFAIAPPAA